MAKTIGNPVSWSAQQLGSAGERLVESTSHLGSRSTDLPHVQTLTTDDIKAALRAGFDDFTACRADVMFLVLVYPMIGLVLMGVGLRMEMLPLLFPIVAGFALLGPVAAVGLYEMSRRREAGQTVRWLDALAVIRAPNFGAILVLGLALVGLYGTWILMADVIYSLTMGPELPVSAGAFASQILGTAEGWALILIGCGVGLGFALIALATTVVSFPMLLDRDVGIPVAVMTSIEVTRRNPSVILTWGFVVAVSLALGSIPFLLGLIVVLPVLGHATWHLYRRAVA